MATIVDAIASFIKQGWRYQGDPNPGTEQEFLANFEIVTGTATDGSAVFSNNPADFPVTFSQLIEEKNRLQQIEDSNSHQAPRRAEYPTLGELADAVYWQQKGDNSKMDAYLAAVEAVKLKYPKS
jgi:hypothetical protein